MGYGLRIILRIQSISKDVTIEILINFTMNSHYPKCFQMLGFFKNLD